MSPPHTFPCHSGLVSARCRGCEGEGGGEKRLQGPLTSHPAAGALTTCLSSLGTVQTTSASFLVYLSSLSIFMVDPVDIWIFAVSSTLMSPFFSAPISLICVDTALCGASISREVCHNISDRSNLFVWKWGAEELRSWCAANSLNTRQEGLGWEPSPCCDCSLSCPGRDWIGKLRC